MKGLRIQVKNLILLSGLFWITAQGNAAPEAPFASHVADIVRHAQEVLGNKVSAVRVAQIPAPLQVQLSIILPQLGAGSALQKKFFEVHSPLFVDESKSDYVKQIALFNRWIKDEYGAAKPQLVLQLEAFNASVYHEQPSQTKTWWQRNRKRVLWSAAGLTVLLALSAGGVWGYKKYQAVQKARDDVQGAQCQSQEERDRLQIELEAAQGELRDKVAEFAQLQQQLEQRQGELQTVQRERAEVQRQSREQLERLQRERDEVQRVQGEFEAAEQAAQEQLQTKERELNEVQEAQRQSQEEVEAVQKARDEAQQQIEKLQKEPDGVNQRGTIALKGHIDRATRAEARVGVLEKSLRGLALSTGAGGNNGSGAPRASRIPSAGAGGVARVDTSKMSEDDAFDVLSNFLADVDAPLKSGCLARIIKATQTISDGEFGNILAHGTSETILKPYSDALRTLRDKNIAEGDVRCKLRTGAFR